MSIKNIVFDIGNVLVRWDPLPVVINFFPEEQFPENLTTTIFKSKIWYDLNLGKLTETDAIKLYSKELKIAEDKLQDLINSIKESLVPIDGSFELLNELYMLKFPLYCITDNIRELIVFLKNKYDFLTKFSDIVVSAELGVLKPNPLMYQKLINSHGFIPSETVFIDDLLPNIQGAIDLGWHGILFTNSKDCRLKLQNLGVEI